MNALRKGRPGACSRVIALLIAGLASIGCVAATPAPLRGAPDHGWVSYQVALQTGVDAPCCYSTRRGAGVRQQACDLDDDASGEILSLTQPVAADAPQDLRIYVQLQHGQPQRLAAYGSACPLRSAEPVQALAGVTAATSVAWLGELARSTGDDGLRNAAVMAMAHHAAGVADQQLLRLSGAGEASALRREALFWMALSRGASGFAAVADSARNDAAPALRAHALFALAQSPQPGAYAALRSSARNDVADEVRSEAAFWMAQTDPQRAEADLLELIRQDRSAAVRERAVFALSQLGAAADGALIRLLRGDYPRAVKRQAVFWLGQSGSDQALAMLDQLLRDPH